MRILVTGGTGCLGHALLPQLAAEGHEVIAIVNPARTPKEIPRLVDRIMLDLGEPIDTELLPSTCDAVIYAAQSRRYREFPDAAKHVVQINAVASHALANYALKAGAQQFIYLSTGSVYQPSPSPIDEQGDVVPNGIYPASKLAAEKLLAPYGQHFALSIMRLFYMYGPQQQRMLVTQLADSIRASKAVSLQGADGIRLTPTFSEDVARICTKAVAETWQGTINISNPECVSLRQLAIEISRVVGKDPVFEQRSDEAPVPMIPDVAKLGRLFDLGSMTDLARGLQQTLTAPSSA